MQTGQNSVSVFKIFLTLLAVGFLAMYFRTYPLHGGLEALSRPSPEALAKTLVEREMKSQLQNAVQKDFPQLSDREKIEMVNARFERLKTEDRVPYENAITKAASAFRQNLRASWKPYLLEADPYHYFYQAEQLLEKGPSAFIRKGGKVFQPLMHTPHGYWEPFLLHPYAGVAWYQLSRLWNPGVTLMESLCFFPLAMIWIVLLTFGWLGKVLRFSLFANAMALLTLLLSPIFIQRSALGWYDTDCYNFIFPALILGSAFLGLQRKQIVFGALGAAFFTGVYALFWSGWSFVLVLAPGAFLGTTLILYLSYRSQLKTVIGDLLRFVGFYFLFACGFLLFFLTPEGFGYSVKMAWTTLNEFMLSKTDIWPNIFLTVGEAAGITFNKLTFLTGNYITFLLAAVGIGLEAKKVFREQDALARVRFIFFTLFSIPLLIMSLKTERFSLLFVFSLAIFIGWAASRIPELFETAFQIWGKAWPRVQSWGRLLSQGAFLLIFLPGLFLLSHIVASGIKPIMDDVWYDSLVEIKSKTPENAVINSWWPPGYFITAIAHRRVTMDGGSQNFHEPFWMAKALFAADERQAAGILRMLNLSGDDALAKLESWGFSVPDAVDLILDLVKLEKPEAFLKLSSRFTNEQKNTLLDLTHGDGQAPPTYLYLYDDLITQNLAVSVLDQWDFRKAQEIQNQRRTRPAREASRVLGRDTGGDYIRDLQKITGPWLKYMAASKLSQGKGDILLFENGVQFDLQTNEASLFLASEKTFKSPQSVFYLDRGVLKEKKYSANTIDVSVLVFEDEGHFYAVAADARLIRSMLFRLYYLKGEGLSFFAPLILKGTLTGGTVVRIFSLDQKQFSRKSVQAAESIR